MRPDRGGFDWRVLGVLSSIGVVASLAWAQTPTWWTAPETAIIKDQATEQNYAPVNLGQLKHVAQQAWEHMEPKLPTNASQVILDARAIIEGNLAAWDLDNALDPAAARTANLAPVNLGQLKAVAQPFYDILRELNYDGPPAGRDAVTKYPWSETPTEFCTRQHRAAEDGLLL